MVGCLRSLLLDLGLLRQKSKVFRIPDNVKEDIDGCPGDEPPNLDALTAQLCAFLSEEVLWCLVGDALLNYYQVPKVISVRSLRAFSD